MAVRPLEPGDPQWVAGYLLAGRLGVGGQGVVYEAYGADGTRVAVKVLFGAGNRWTVREIAAARRVAAFCTARILSADAQADRPYIVSEFVDGPTLRTAVIESGTFGADELHRLAVAVATALAAIHSSGVVHRDLKPDNILLGPDGPRVIDFGIAHVVGASATVTDGLVGTPIYMAPEAFDGGRAGPAADVWAWGAIMLFAATGRDPFRADNLAAIAARVRRIEPDTTILAARLRSLVSAALAKDPQARPSAQALLIDLIGGDARQEPPLAAGSRVARHLAGAGPAPLPSLAERAETTFNRLTAQDREAAPGLFLRLVAADSDTGEVLRQASARELLAACVDRSDLLSAFVAAGLLEESASGYRLVHPGLLRAWPRLRGWIDAERVGLPVHRQVAAAAQVWNDNGRKDGDLPAGTRLADAVRWVHEHHLYLRFTPLERRYLAAGAEAAARRRRRRRLLSGIVTVLLVLAMTGVGGALLQWRSASSSRDLLTAKAVAARADALRGTDPISAELMNVAAWRIAQSPETRGGLYSAYGQRERASFTDPLPDAPDVVRLLSPDGAELVRFTPSDVHVWDVTSGREVARARIDLPGVRWAALSPNARYLAAASTTQIKIWDFGTLRPLRHTIAFASPSTPQALART
jgi:predicted Ser/Thr protein kinase